MTSAQLLRDVVLGVLTLFAVTMLIFELMAC